MSQGQDTGRYEKDPSELLDLFRKMIDRLDSGEDDGTSTPMEAQLREISKAVEKLEKIGVAVPDALRAEKTRLAAALGVRAETTQALNHLADELDEILKDLKTRLARSAKELPTGQPRKKRSHSPKTDKSALRQLILEALRQANGSARKKDILKFMEKQLQGKLLPGDLEWRDATNDYAWQNNACWERFNMIQDGILKSESPRGTWELNKEHP